MTVPAAVLIAEARRAWRPPPNLTSSEWADRHYYLSADAGAAEPGRWHTLAFQRGIMDAMSDVRNVVVSVYKSKRVGYTSVFLADIGRQAHLDPCPMMVIQPSLNDARGFSKESIGPLFRDCLVLTELIPASAQRKNSLLLIRFPGGLVHLVGARSPAAFRRVGRRRIYGDEVDDYPQSAGTEGDPLALAFGRSEAFWNRKAVWGSTPTISGMSRIERLYAESDQRLFYVPCPHCQCFASLVFHREMVHRTSGEPTGHFMDWTPGQPEGAHFVCRQCGSEIDPSHRRSMIEAADRLQLEGVAGVGWVAHAPFDGHAGFHLWAAYNYASPNSSWAQIAKEYEAAERQGPEQLKTVWNTVLGLTWKESTDAPEWELLYRRREAYQIGTCPPGVLFLTCGVDVQPDLLYYEVVGWGRGKESWSIDAGVIAGATSDTSARGPWPKLAALLERTFPHAGGAALRIERMAIDSGFNTQTVYGWARQYPMSRVIAVKGTDGVSILLGAPSKTDVTVSGRKVGYKYWPVAGHVAKTELYGWLKLQAPTDEELAAGMTHPPGYCHTPQYGEAYYKGLTAEQLVPHLMASGFTMLVWQLIPGRQNHPLDCRVYARAAAAGVGLDRFAETDWLALERALGLEQPSPPQPDANAPATTISHPPSAAGAHAKAPFIERRRGYIRRGR